MDTSTPNHKNSPEHPTASSSLLSEVRRMDAEGWSRLVNTFGPIVYRWCRSSHVSESDVPDIVQNVFMSVARSIVEFQRMKEKGSFRSWLATITRNQVRDYFRRQAKHPVAAGGTDALVQLQQYPADLDSTISPESAVRPLVSRALAEIRTEFGQANWDAFWMTTIDGKSGSEVAEKLGISVAVVYQSKTRILRRLRQRLSEFPMQ